jgi:hypothetical protein
MMPTHAPPAAKQFEDSPAVAAPKVEATAVQ